MPVISDQQAKQLAGGITAIGGVNNYGGGSGEYSGKQNIAQVSPAALAPRPTQSLVSKIGNIGKTVGTVALTGVEAGAKFAIHTPKYIYDGVSPYLQGIANVATGNLSRDLKNISDQQAQLEANQQSYREAFRSGKMSREQYSRLSKDLATSFQDLSKQSESVATQADRGNIVEGAANTAMVILSAGRLQLAANSAKLAATASLAARLRAGAVSKVLAGQVSKGGAKFLVKGVGGDASKKALTTLVDTQANNLEKAIMHVPGVRNLILRNTSLLAKDGIRQLPGEGTAAFLKRNARDITVGMLIKRPLFYQLNIDSAKDVYSDMVSGKYGDAAVTAGMQSLQLLEGPIGSVVHALKSSGTKLRELTHGTGSLIDTLSSQIGNKQADQVAQFVLSGEQVASRTGKTTMSGEDIYKLIQENNLRGNSENVNASVEAILRNYQHAGIDLTTLTPKQIAEDYLSHQEAVDIAKGLHKVPGLTADEVRNLVVIRWDSVAKRSAYNRAIKAIEGSNGALDPQKLVDAVFETGAADDIGNAWRNNPILAAQVSDIIRRAADSGNPEDLKAILSIPTATVIPKGLSKKATQQLSDLGYGLAVPRSGQRSSAYVDLADTRKLISHVTAPAKEITTVTPASIPARLKQLVEESKAYKTVEEFVAAQKGKTVTTYKDVTTVTGDGVTTGVPKLNASKTMTLGKPGVKGSSTAVYHTSDANLTQIVRSAIIAAKGTAKTAGEHADALKAAGFSDADIKAIRDFAVKSADGDGKVDAAKLQSFIEDRLSAGKTTTTRVPTTTKAKVNEADAREAFDLARAEPKTTTSFTRDSADVFDVATAPKPMLKGMAGFLSRIGLSPESTNTEAFKALSAHVAASLDNSGAARELGFSAGGNDAAGGQVILSRLQQYVDNIQANKFLKTASLTFGKARPAITDIRQLTKDEIIEALSNPETGFKLTKAQAKSIQKSVLQGYLDTPLSLRGFGDKVLDFNYRYNPAHKYYSRAQSALRYSYNPFFQLQEGVETSLFSGLQGGNKITRLAGNHGLWGKTKAELDDTVAQLEQARVFGGKAGGNEGLLSSSLAGEAAQDQVLGRLTADITHGQKQDLAGLAIDLAKRQGTTVENLLKTNPEQIADALRIVVQYPREGFLASPLARTLNVAFFPMRYNLKVAKMTADILAKQPPAVQYATIHGVMQLNDWLKSDEGIRWRAENNDAIQVFNWLSPLNNLTGVMNALKYGKQVATGQDTDGIAALGQLGGLPFGIIGQVLDSMGLITLNNPYVDPTTGNTIPKYIPESTRAKAATALTDLLGSVFTYPGRTLGLPGKQAALRDAVGNFIKTDDAEYLKRTYQNPDGSLNARGEAELSPGQKNLMRVLLGDTSPQALDALYQSPQGFTMPPATLPFNIPETVPINTRTQVLADKAARKAAAKKAKAAKPKVVAKPVGQY